MTPVKLNAFLRIVFNEETTNLIITDHYTQTAILSRESHPALYDLLKLQVEDQLDQIIFIKDGISKGDLMDLVYDGDHRNVDSALPQGWCDEMHDKLPDQPIWFWYVWDYREHRAFGEPKNLRELIEAKGIRVIDLRHKS